ncbi:MAG: ATP-binding cassette domain-containing protein [Anditalea sp.]
MLLTKNIRFHYNESNQFSIDDLSLTSGDELLILGKSGSGKTTMLNILGGLLPPSRGEVIVNGVPIYELEGAELDKFRGENIGIVFQKPHLLKPLTVEENIKLANYFVGNETSNAVQELLRDLGMEDKGNAKTYTLSEGEAQRVSIARALANRPKVILADEPTASLDDENAQLVIQLLQIQSRKLNALLVIVTHDQRVKDHIANHIIMGE